MTCGCGCSVFITSSSDNRSLLSTSGALSMSLNFFRKKLQHIYIETKYAVILKKILPLMSKVEARWSGG